VLFLLFEDDLLDNRAEALRRICSLLGVADADFDLEVWSLAAKAVSVPVHPILRHLNRATVLKRFGRTGPAKRLKKLLQREVPRKLDATARTVLTEEHFGTEIEALQQLIGRDLQRWRSVGKALRSNGPDPVRFHKEAS
jgi:hypothetical protein